MKTTEVAIDARKLPTGDCTHCGTRVAVQEKTPYSARGWCSFCRMNVSVIADQPLTIEG